ncbi:MAG: YdcF family protein [Actinomyces sp.]|uniref:YdcF family protein n=1 Tax=Actinomyces sp. TaxID=29317 RepID=UPI0026DAD07F|nr:YdcF family protein [Actinomyces sp.]MDO4242587.1 YdcF family protein [Actinomyces sp.]
MSLATVIAAVVAAEVTHRLASRAYLGRGAAMEDDAVEAVVVLGFADPGATAGFVNRRRVAYALRSQRGRRSTLIASGGAVAGPVPEAELLAAHARALGYGGALVTEPASGSTWENIRNVIPLIEGAQRIVVVSDAVHAAKARYYLRLQRPDLAARLAPADDHRLGEDLLLKLPTAALGLADLIRAHHLPGPRHGGPRGRRRG